jgi:hypothetical protein
VLLAFVSLLVVPALALVAEAALRAYEPAALEWTGALSDLHVYSAEYGWELRPDSVIVERGRRTTIDGRGCRRAPSATRAEAAGGPRVLLLGDSVTFGFEVDDAETFAERLGEAGVAAVNLAVPGWGTDQELLRLRRQTIDRRPRLLVLGVCMENDFADNHSSTFFYDGIQPKPYFTVEGGALVLHDRHLRSWRRRAAVWLRRRSHLYNRVAGAPPATHEGWPQRMARALTPREEARDVTYRLAAEVAATARTSGVGVLVLLHPNKDGFLRGSDLRDGFFDSPHLAGVPVVDMGDVYRQRGLRWSDVALDAMGHLKPLGHRVVAETILARLAPGDAQRGAHARAR